MRNDVSGDDAHDLLLSRSNPAPIVAPGQPTARRAAGRPLTSRAAPVSPPERRGRKADDDEAHDLAQNEGRKLLPAREPGERGKAPFERPSVRNQVEHGAEHEDEQRGVADGAPGGGHRPPRRNQASERARCPPRPQGTAALRRATTTFHHAAPAAAERPSQNPLRRSKPSPCAPSGNIPEGAHASLPGSAPENSDEGGAARRQAHNRRIAAHPRGGIGRRRENGRARPRLQRADSFQEGPLRLGRRLVALGRIKLGGPPDHGSQRLGHLRASVAPSRAPLASGVRSVRQK